MKSKILFVILAVFMASSCREEKNPEPILPNTEEQIPFTGNWSRQFYAGVGALHTATYKIYQDSIRYQLSGSIGVADYVMIKDTFLLKYKRYIGHTIENRLYVILFKDVSADSLTLYKQRIVDIEEGLKLPIPSDTTTLNHGWNTYHKD